MATTSGMALELTTLTLMLATMPFELDIANR
jgi:hypothetical protein